MSLSNQLLSIYELIDHEKLLEKKNIPTPQFNIVFQNFDIPEIMEITLWIIQYKL